jgi:competence protein ComEC
VLIDGGPRDGNITAELERAGVGSIDALFLSHPHADHVDGFVDVLERLEVGRVVGPVTMGWGVGVRVMEAARAAGVPLQTTVAGDIFRFGTGITVEVISPADGPTPERSEETVNAYSLVLRVRAGSVDAILPGDVGAQTQAELTVADLQANVLVAPHHGSADVHPGFVEAVDPRLTVVTVGENRYGHPTQRALRLFQRHGRVLRTDRHGAVEVCSRPEAVEVTTGR